ncbi:uncharacterized protein RJT21DRAFT_112997 [Scheffersomyces amazonensis]|uniref:uncharacterized protein n=1 Tax=Scheffersomyces amazonensis TaxID=1078765 RepID=UPI00315D7245
MSSNHNHRQNLNQPVPTIEKEQDQLQVESGSKSDREIRELSQVQQLPEQHHEEYPSAEIQRDPQGKNILEILKRNLFIDENSAIIETGKKDDNISESPEDYLLNSFPIIVTITTDDLSIISPDLVPYFSVQEVSSDKTSEFEGKHIQQTSFIPTSLKPQLDSLIRDLYDSNINYTLNYDKFVSHPGVLFIKNVSPNLIISPEDPVEEIDSVNDSITIKNPQNKFITFLKDHTLFKSFNNLKLFNSNKTPEKESNDSSGYAYVIVKFDNHLDVEDLIISLNQYSGPNEFNDKTSIPLFLNRYVNKRERNKSHPNRRHHHSHNQSQKQYQKATLSSSDNNNNDNSFNLIILENLSKFFPGHLKVSKCEFSIFINVFKQFGNEIEFIHFPIAHQEISDSDKEDNNDLMFHLLHSFAYIKFHPSVNMVENTLKILYYLNDLTWEEFIGFKFDGSSANWQHALLNHTPNLESVENGIKISIAQHKHNHLLTEQTDYESISFTLGVRNDGLITVNTYNFNFLAPTLLRYVNYQDTNIYVNNLATLFKNNDELWREFWEQFGLIKSATIIKPNFYHNNEDSSDSSSSFSQAERFGKIGFVFYEHFKMSIKAILLTNNKSISSLLESATKKNASSIIQSSFAIQKPNLKYSVSNQQQFSSIPLTQSISSTTNLQQYHFQLQQQHNSQSHQQRRRSYNPRPSAPPLVTSSSGSSTSTSQSSILSQNHPQLMIPRQSHPHAPPASLPQVYPYMYIPQFAPPPPPPPPPGAPTHRYSPYYYPPIASSPTSYTHTPTNPASHSPPYAFYAHYDFDYFYQQEQPHHQPYSQNAHILIENDAGVESEED